MNNSKIQQLSKKTIELLEATKKEMTKYAIERKKLFEYFANKNDVEKWEKYIVEIEELINRNNNKYDK